MPLIDALENVNYLSGKSIWAEFYAIVCANRLEKCIILEAKQVNNLGYVEPWKILSLCSKLVNDTLPCGALLGSNVKDAGNHMMQANKPRHTDIVFLSQWG